MSLLFWLNKGHKPINNKISLYIFQLYLQRASVLKEYEKEKWSQIDLSYITDENDAEHNHKSVKETNTNQPGDQPVGYSNVYVVTLTTSLEALNRLVAKLDKCLAEKKGGKDQEGFKIIERIAGLPSKSQVLVVLHSGL